MGLGLRLGVSLISQSRCLGRCQVSLLRVEIHGHLLLLLLVLEPESVDMLLLLLKLSGQNLSLSLIIRQMLRRMMMMMRWELRERISRMLDMMSRCGGRLVERSQGRVINMSITAVVKATGLGQVLLLLLLMSLSHSLGL